MPFYLARELEIRHRKLAKALGKPLNFDFRLDSKVFSYLNKIKTQYTRLKTRFKSIHTCFIISLPILDNIEKHGFLFGFCVLFF